MIHVQTEFVPGPILSVVTILGTITEVGSFFITIPVNVFGVLTTGVSILSVETVKSGIKDRKGDIFAGVIIVFVLPEIYVIESSLITLSVVLVGAELAMSYVVSHIQREPVCKTYPPSPLPSSLDMKASPLPKLVGSK